MADESKTKRGPSRKKTAAGSSRNGAPAEAKDSASKSTSNAASTASKATEPATAAREAASAVTVAAAKAVAAAAGKLKTPILVGGAALAGVAGGAAIRNRLSSTRSRGLGQRLKNVALPKSSGGVDLDALTKLDFDKIASAAERVGTYGRQIDEVAGAVRRASESAKERKK